MSLPPEELDQLRNRNLNPKRIAQVLDYYGKEFTLISALENCIIYKIDSIEPFYVFFCLNGFTTAINYQITNRIIITTNCGDVINIKTGHLNLAILPY